MVQKLGAVHPVKGLAGISVFDDGSLRCVAVELKGGGFCFYNPVKGLSEEWVQSLKEFGSVKYLLSPNHYHHRALSEYAECFVKAKVCGSTAATSRLNKQTGLTFASLAGLKKLLPASIALVEPKGLKTGEVWLRIKQDNEVCWLVGDAFCGPKQTKSSSFSATPELLKPFPSFGVGNRSEYVDWVTAQIKTDKPTTLIPCHGGMIRSKQLPQKLQRLVADGLG